jgi:hypothetical protein
LIINRLHQVLRPFVLRRLKHKVINTQLKTYFPLFLEFSYTMSLLPRFVLFLFIYLCILGVMILIVNCSFLVVLEMKLLIIVYYYYYYYYFYSGVFYSFIYSLFILFLVEALFLYVFFICEHSQNILWVKESLAFSSLCCSIIFKCSELGNINNFQKYIFLKLCEFCSIYGAWYL